MTFLGWFCFTMLAVAVGPKAAPIIFLAWLAYATCNPNDRIAKLEKRIKELEAKQ